MIITGGTIDSVDDVVAYSVIPRQESLLPRFIGNLKLPNAVEFSTVCMKDSRAITQDDRQQILKTIENSSASRIIISHGTFTMPDTARYLQARLTRNDQVVILTGSIIPIEFPMADAGFSLGYAFSQVEVLGTRRLHMHERPDS